MRRRCERCGVSLLAASAAALRCSNGHVCDADTTSPGCSTHRSLLICDGSLADVVPLNFTGAAAGGSGSGGAGAGDLRELRALLVAAKEEQEQLRRERDAALQAAAKAEEAASKAEYRALHLSRALREADAALAASKS